MDGDTNTTKSKKGWKGENIAENHNHMCPEGTSNIER